MRRELAAYKGTSLVMRTWVEEEEVDDFTSLFRQAGCDVIDVLLAGRTLSFTDPYARLSHILRNPHRSFAEPTRK